MKRVFSDKEFLKKLWTLMVPIVLQNLMLAMVAVSDALMLGNVQQDAMSAVSLATQVQFVQNMFIGCCASTIGILGAQYWGKGNRQAVDRVFSIGLRINVLISVIFFIGCVLFPDFLMSIYTNEQVLIDYGVKYLRIAGYSYLMTGISQCYLILMKISDHADTSAKISSLAVVLNIVLNAVLIFGLGPFKPMSVEGAATATLIARIVELSLSIGMSFRTGYIHPGLKELVSHDMQLLLDFIKCAYPLLGAYLFWGIGITLYSVFMGHLGTDATAANAVAAVVRDIVCCLSVGVGSAGGIIVGNELGAGDLDKGRDYGEKLLRLSLLIGIVEAVVMLAISPVIMHFVSLTPEAARILKGMLAVIAVYMIGRGVNDVTINGIFASGGDTLFDMYSLAVCMWCIAIPLAALGTFVFHWPVVLVYACTCLDEVGKLPWVYLHFRKYKWVKDLTR